jgi:MGT family glycosyltransferase
VRVLVSSTPEYSHLAPLIPLALELQRRGHEVLVACSPKLGRYAEQLGLSSAPAGLDLDPDRLAAGELNVAPPPGLKPAEMHRWALGAVFLGLFATALAGDLRTIADDFRPDLMIRDRGEFAAWVVGEAIGVPVVTVTFGRLPDPTAEADAAGEAFQDLRRRQGLEADPELSTLYSGRVFVPAPRSYADPTVTVLPTVSFVHPMLHDASPSDRLPSWVRSLGERPTIYVSLGNIVNREEAFRPFLEALANEPVDLVLTVGRAIDPDAFGVVPANVHIERYVPQSLLLASVDVVVCHGGFNTVMGALTAGRPLVLAPMSADQPMHADRCVSLGVGRLVDGHRLDPNEIRNATRAVLDDATYRTVAQRLQREIAGLPDVGATADLAESTPVGTPYRSTE